MKLIQANIWTGRLANQIRNFVQDEQADFACLQEVINVKGDGEFFTTFGDLKEAGVFSEGYHSPMFTFNLMQKQATFGNGILSKYPIIDSKTIFTRLEHKTNFDFEHDDYNIRNLQHVVVDVNGHHLHILDHHGHHVPNHKDGDEETDRQCVLIAEYISKLKGPVILSGDFNLAPHSKSLKPINAILRNLSVEAKLNTTRTALTHKKEVCDYIFVNEFVNVKSFWASEEMVSDHMALVLEFEV
jgi:endonuclease/exonuclease/phosphatase family metal-dependent hydrolase